MAKGDYIKGNDRDFLAQLKTCNSNLNSYITTLGLDPAVATALAADVDYHGYVLDSVDLMKKDTQQWTAWKDILRFGGNLPPAGRPVPPVLPTPVPPAVMAGIETRFRQLVRQIKSSTNYNVSIGEALGIEGADKTAPDFAALQPQLAVEISGNRVEVDWGWQGNSAYLDQCELQVDRGDGKGFVLLAYDTTPGYVDTQLFPAVPVKWTYKAIYRADDTPVGQWSNPVSLTVSA